METETINSVQTVVSVRHIPDVQPQDIQPFPRERPKSKRICSKCGKTKEKHPSDHEFNTE